MKYSLRSLMIVVTLFCLALGGRIEYHRGNRRRGIRSTPSCGLTRISHSAKKRTAFLSHKLLFNDNFSPTKKAVRCLQSVASQRSISSLWVRGK